MNDWAYIFMKLCDGSFKGPRELREKAEEAAKAQGGELKGINPEHIPLLEKLLNGSVRAEITAFDEYFDDESNAGMRAFYGQQLDCLIGELKLVPPATGYSGFTPRQLLPYLAQVKETGNDRDFVKEPLLRLMAVVMYNREIATE